MNIWIVHPSAGGPGVGRHWRPYFLAQAWNGMGHRASVVCAASHHLMTGASHQAGRARIAEVDYWFVEAPYYRSGLGRLRNGLAYARRLAVDAPEIARLFGRPDLIVASIPHLFHVRTACRVARHFGAKFWVEVRDLWPESMVALGLAPRWHPLVMLIAMQERRAYRSADRVISLLAGAEPYMRERGLGENRFVWVPNGVSQGELHQAAAATAIEHPLLRRAQALKAEGRQIAVYAGAMGPANALDTILGAARVLAQVQPKIHFLLVGGGSLRGHHETQAKALGNLEFCDEVERPVAHALLSASDCAVIVFRRSALYRHGISPNKLFDHCLFAPRSVVACQADALARLEELVQIRCEPEEPDTLASAIAAALAARSRPLAERIAAASKFSYSLLAARYLA